ncbi:TlpA disulfide reductase family protein [Peribacillus loiseleuriae]|uniref:Alkyl hydroperoxide reductase n=1 Tax=Peribacillus loiseleuriae TaxID=1679170 RepID=A0A0K9GSU0_9BACI|nr:TlpA disulfide reductase family protein [Peribacillus loiseleuriae]KMY49681.1 alkyl hydroperoxide reductase [Peribacillus loiseleuriae]
MYKKIIAAVFLVVLIAVAIVQAMEPRSGLDTGQKAPDFELETLSGEKVKLSDYQGKKVMLNFWATWCGPCREEMPDMETFAKGLGKDTVILAINLDPQNDVQTFVDEMGVTFPILLDSQNIKNAVNKRYKVAAMPTTYFIDSEGLISRKHIGQVSLQSMEKYIEDMK